jgi:hypothetical protein
MNRKIILLGLVYCLFLGCGSGGGGEDNGGSEGSASTGIKILHAAMDLPPVNITSTAKVGGALAKTRFAEVRGFTELPQGAQNISVQSVDGGTGPFNFSITVEKNQRTQVLVYGSREKLGINATLLEPREADIASGFAAIRIAHGAEGAASIKGSIGATALPAVVAYGNVSGYISVPAGNVLIKVARAVDGKSLANELVPVEEGRSYTYFIAGEIDYLTVNNLLVD